MINWLHKIFSSPTKTSANAMAAEAAALQNIVETAQSMKVRGDAHLEQGDVTAAAASYRQAVALDPGFAKAHSNLGFALMEQGLVDEAEHSLRQALAFDAENADTHFMLGNLLVMARGALDSGCEHLCHAVVLRPFFEAAYLDWHRYMARRGRLGQVRQFLEEAVALQPMRADFHHYLGALYQEQQQFDAAESAFRHALQIQPGNAEVLANLGFALCGQGKVPQGMAFYDDAIAALRDRGVTAPEEIDVQMKRAGLLLSLNRVDAALEAYEAILAQRPERIDARLGRGWVALLTGNFASGWLDYKDIARQSAIPRPEFAQPLWLNDADVAGKTVLLHADEGMGDALQLVRYVDRVAAMGATVFLQVHAPLLPLLSALPGVARIFPDGASMPAFDFHCPLSNVCLAFKTDLASIPRKFPYVTARKEQAARWAARLGRQAAPRIGVVWSGNPLFRKDALRSIPLRKFATLFSQVDCHFYLLQKDLRNSDREFLPDRQNVTNLDGELLDFSETAAVLANLDLVITVDTAVAHLAGAMGKPVWILLPFAPDFRWLMERTDSPWYPSARLFRQPAIGAWDAVLDDVSRQLQAQFGKSA